jgi:hypothetical protein
MAFELLAGGARRTLVGQLSCVNTEKTLESFGVMPEAAILETCQGWSVRLSKKPEQERAPRGDARGIVFCVRTGRTGHDGCMHPGDVRMRARSEKFFRCRRVKLEEKPYRNM